MTTTPTPYTIPGTEVHQMRSNISGLEYEVAVAVMAQVEPGKRYPVLYMSDANIGFPLLVPTIALMQAGKELPEMIVAGVGYTVDAVLSDPASMSTWQRRRAWDLVPNKQEEGWGGGAPDFLRFFKEQLMPFVCANYPADEGGCAHVGTSLGGLFGLYAMLSSPATFRRIHAGSPAISRSRDLLYSLEANLAESTKELPVRLFMSVGALEADPMPSNMAALADRLASRGYRGFELTTKVFEGETHLSAAPGALSRGLRTLFAP